MSARRSIELIGVPFNSSGTSDGVARAPAALRRAGLVDALRAVGLAVRDAGDVDLEPGGPIRDAVSGIIAPGALVAMIRAVRGAVAAAGDRGAFPVVIGGDCPILIGCLAAERERSPGLLFVDGHDNAWPAHESTTGEAADMELGLLLGPAPVGLPADLRHEIPELDPGAVTIVGARDGAELDGAGVASIGDRVEMIPPAALGSRPGDVVGRVIDRLAARGRWWFHVDLDVLSTDSLAAVDYRQPGGLDWPTLTAISRRALAAPGLGGWDVTIFNPDLDPDGAGARRIVAFTAEALRPA